MSFKTTPVFNEYAVIESQTLLELTCMLEVSFIFSSISSKAQEFHLKML